MTDDREAEAALGRIAKMAESWAALAIPGAENVAAEVDALCGRQLLDIIHRSRGPAARLDRVTRLAESWLTPGSPGLFYPAAGQCVLDAAKVPEDDWQQRAERAEATVDALYEYATTYRGDPGMALACDDILGIIGREQTQERSDDKESP